MAGAARKAVLSILIVTVSEAFALGLAHHQVGRLAEAEAIYRQILAVHPGNPESLGNLGVIACQLGRYEAAADLFRQAIKANPNLAGYHNSLGTALKELGLFHAAMDAFRTALELDPKHVAAHYNIASALNAIGQHDAAILSYQAAIQLKPDYAEAYNNMGGVLEGQGQGDEAIAAYRSALRINANFAEAHNNLGIALSRQGLVEEGIAALRRALEFNPDFTVAHSGLLAHLHYLPDSTPFALFEEHRRWDRIHARPLAKLITPHGNDRDPERRLRIGYVSPDFWKHAVGFLLEGLLASHDRARVEIFCYADVVREDTFTGRLREHAGHWRTISGRTDEQVAALVREDRIDVLVDLAGHTARNRLLVFARKPAPVQVTYLGYPDTTGMSAIDHRLTDAHADPPGTTEHLHTEHLMRLPDCAWCFRPSDEAPPVGAPPVLHTGNITFGCSNIRPKITGEMLVLWAKLLNDVPGSRLLLKNSGFQESSVRQRTLASLAKAGISPGRVEFVGLVPTLAEHLAIYGRVDIALDTFPYHGTATTCEALWMGVPVVTLAGRTHTSRVGASLLTNVGMPELIATSADDYIRIAALLASDVQRLSGLRSNLRERMAASPLMDGPRFARNVEKAYRTMWRAWCEKQSSHLSS